MVGTPFPFFSFHLEPDIDAGAPQSGNILSDRKHSISSGIRIGIDIKGL